jgi:hypothetical protein
MISQSPYLAWATKRAVKALQASRLSVGQNVAWLEREIAAAMDEAAAPLLSQNESLNAERKHLVAVNLRAQRILCGEDQP